MVWAGDAEVMLWTGDHYHVLAVTPQALLVDEAGRPIRELEIGDRVRAHCTPAPDGEAVAVRIETGTRCRSQTALPSPSR